MKPVLLTIFGQPISSLGVFLIIAFLSATFVVWRIIRSYELDEEKSLDLILWTLLGGLLGARIYHVLFHLDQFNSLLKFFMVNKYAGLSFWGGLIGGLLFLLIFSKRYKIGFYQAADIGIVGAFLGFAIASLGCFFGGCQYGLNWDSNFAVTQIGVLGKRFPLQLFEAITYLIIFYILWRIVVRFHFRGKVLAIGLLYLGIVKTIFEFFRGDRQYLLFNISIGNMLSLVLIIGGIYIYYAQSRRSIVRDISYCFSLLYNRNRQKNFVLKIRRNWYNLRVDFKFKRQRLRKGLLRSVNIHSNPSEFK